MAEEQPRDQKLIEIVKINGDEFGCICPFHDDTEPSLYVNFEKNKAVCFADCYKGTVTGLVAKLLGISSYKSNFIDVSKVFVFNGDSILEQSNADNPERADDWTSASINDLYLKSRKFNNQILDDWKIEVSNISKSVRIPFFNDKKDFLGFVYRFTYDHKPKYKYSFGMRKETFFGIDHYDNTYPILVEGSLDAIWLHQCGVTNALSLLGCQLLPYQLEILKQWKKPVIIALDNDLAGRRASEKLVNTLKGVGVEAYELKIPDGFKDAQEMSEEQIKEIFK
jgi:DNA primase